MLGALAVFVIALVVYGRTLCPTIAVGDSGQLITAAYTLGIPHPPGYPLFCLIGKLFTLLPMGSMAYRVNLMSACFAAATSVILYLLLRQMGLAQVLAAVAALIFAFSRTLWSQAVIAEVYTQGAFASACLILLAYVWSRNPQRRSFLYLGAWLSGLSIVTHYVSLVILPILVFFIIGCDRTVLRRPRLWFGMIVLLALGLSVFLYLPIRSLANPPIDWGNPETFSSMMDHILRRQFIMTDHLLRRQFAGYAAAARSQPLVGGYAQLLMQEFTFPVAILGLIGAIALWRRDRRWAALTTVSFLALGPGLYLVSNAYTPPHMREGTSVFFIQSYFVMAVWIGIGLATLAGWLRQRGARQGWVTLLAATLPLVPLSSHLSANDLHAMTFAHDYGMNILKGLEPNSALFTQGPNRTCILMYLKIVEGQRPDCIIVDRDSDVFGDHGYGEPRWRKALASDEARIRQEVETYFVQETEAEFIRTSSRPVYFTDEVDLRDLRGYRLDPVGLVYRVQPAGEAPPDDEPIWETFVERGLDSALAQRDYLVRELVATYLWQKASWLMRSGRRSEARETLAVASQCSAGLPALRNNIAVVYDRGGWGEDAEREYRQGLTIDPKSFLLHWNLGRFYLQWHRLEEARREFLEVIRVYPRFAPVHLKLAEVYHLQGRPDSAIAALEQYLALEPNETRRERARVAIQRIRGAEHYLR